jgi:hypothetical protein
MIKITISVEEPVNAAVSVEQSMSAPANVTKDAWTAFTASTSAEGSGGWSEPIGVYLAIEKKGIKAADVSIRVDTGDGYSYPKFTDEGDRLVALISTKTPLTGDADPESASWTTKIELSFATTGAYVLNSWAEDRSSGDELTLVTYDTVQVASAVVIPDPTPDPNSTNDSEVITPVTPVVPVTPANNSSVEQSAATANRS